ncbi:MAG: signal recognition particle-docking protein FtsY [Synechococcus sp.]
MVFDWFKRNLGSRTPEAVEPERAAEPPAAAESAEPPAPEPAEPAAAPEPEPAAPEPVVAAAPPASGVDEDALAWARQAYARLKAQQEQQAAAVAVPAAPPPAEPAVPAPAAPEPVQLEAPAPELSQAEAPAPLPSAPGAASLPAEPPQPAEPSPPEPLAAAPEASAPPLAAAPAPPEPPAPPVGLSLLEQAAALRQQRQQELIGEPAPATPAAAPQDSPVSPGTPAPAAAPTPAPATPAAESPEPSLGAFDDTFTWSAEVLAAQGRQIEEISLEEIDWLGRLRRGLEKTRRGFVTQLLDRLGDDPLTPEILDDLETTLLRADVGVQATDQVLEALRQRLNEEVVDPAEGIRFLKEQLRGLLEEPIRSSGQPLLAPERERLNVWLMVGVNGVGKTTTLGKLANLAVRSGYSCLIAAADTFRAAAVQQVQVWGERSSVPVIANPSANADPAAVVYDALGAARAHGTELVLVDTAGRLQTKHNLMEELSKVRRIVDKLAPEAHVESLLVLDASQGQNGLRQAMAFASAAGLTGVVLTKLDGSARGGVAIAVAHEAGLPIRFIGAGEGIRDLRPFNSFEFVEALLAS